MSLETDPIDLLLDEQNDLVIQDGDLVFSTGLQAVVQGCRIRLQMFQGEWFLDLDAGVPYWNGILGEKASIAIPLARQALRAALLRVPNVAEVTKLDLTFDGRARTLTVKWRVRTAFGDSAVVTTPITIAGTS